MNVWGIIILVLLGVMALPIMAYLVVKFGAAGYFRAKQRNQRQHKNE